MAISRSVEVFLMKSSLPYYLFIAVSLINTTINLTFRLPAIVLWDLFALFPLLDEIISKDWINPTLKQTKELEDSVWFLMPLYLGLLVDWLMAYYYFSAFFLLSTFDQILGLFLLSLCFSSTFLIAHELMHRNSKVCRFIATLHQVKCLYMHFTVAHVYGHHKDVSTPLDPASAQKGVSVYEFIPKSIVGCYKQALRLRPKEVSFYTLCYAVYLCCIYYMFDFGRVIVAIVAAFAGVVMLESINYIEHYGLRRKQLPDGTFEKVTVRHSWNAPHRISNYLLFKLQRHSDHHQNSLKPYQTLCSYEESPQLPEGYLGCLTLCFSPSKWFEIMDPLVDEYMSSEKSLKGTQLKSMAASKQKVKDFSNKRMYFFGALAAINIVIRASHLVLGI